MLLSRDDFRNAVFKRDGNKCAACGAPAVDAHHIVERRLWPDGGYYVSNGASVCGPCHLKAESTELSCDELRERCGIKEILLPPHFYSDQPIDKWGNPILPNGQRLKGELFHDESVQKVIRPVLHLFTDRVKYPRTHHLPWSPNVSSDDKIIPTLAAFEGQEVVITVKMDGEQTSMYRDGFHARSIDTASHPSRDWLWGLHRQIGHEIPKGWRICGENLFAKHSIHYKNLPAHFLVFSIWNEKNECLSWDETETWSELLDLKTVAVLERAPWNEKATRALEFETYNGDPCEGYVVRVARAFQYKEFKDVVAKFVRKNHVHTHSHWMREAVVPNKLKEGAHV
jgi:RNA ligase-like protein